MINGSIPIGFSKFSKLKGLDLATNELTGTKGDWPRLARVRELRLEENKLRGKIPPSFGLLTRLTRLYLYGNRLTGTVPESLGSLRALTGLMLDSNHLRGTIPATLGNLSQIKTLQLQDNSLSGTIPAELCNLETLKDLRLNNNDLKGSIPDEVGNMRSLEKLMLNNNRLLNGTIPATLSKLENLFELYLDGTSIDTATFPTSLCCRFQNRFQHKLSVLINDLKRDISLRSADEPSKPAHRRSIFPNFTPPSVVSFLLAQDLIKKPKIKKRPLVLPEFNFSVVEDYARAQL